MCSHLNADDARLAEFLQHIVFVGVTQGLAVALNCSLFTLMTRKREQNGTRISEKVCCGEDIVILID